MARRRATRVGGAPAGLAAVARIVAAILAYQVLLIATSIGLYFVGLALIPSDGQATFGLIALGLAEGAAILAVVAVWRTLDGRPIAELGLRHERAAQYWLRGAGVAALMMGFVVLAWYTLLDGATWDVNPDPVKATIVLVGGLLGFLIQGPAEEILFRGHLFENVRDQWGLHWAVCVSSVAFGLFHAPNPGFGVLPFINLVLFGVATALYKTFVDDGQLWGVFGIHTMWNWLQQVVFGLPNSGIVTARDNALFTVTPNTSLPEAIWGGGFGPEGTLATTLVLLALIGVCLRRSRRPRCWQG
ncbi:MAG TPA: type II CAAX endopeptidase family protein [Chloroflexota bacterium]|jgi:hypothetical protein|nr:type II CAAX endopeptidase family protein [Chloroflexota bacterium]